MRTYRLVAENIKQYVIEDEIVKYISNDPQLKTYYEDIRDKQTNSVVILVSLNNEITHHYDLNVIVKYNEKSRYGYYEYFLVEDFVNTKTNLYKLVESLSISPGIELTEFLDSIHTQLTELGVGINQEYLLRTDHKSKILYFEKTFRDVSSN